MTLESQVVSLKLSKRLKELGVKKDSYFTWAKSAYSGRWTITTQDSEKLSDIHELSDEPGAGDYYDHVSAFTVAELGEIMNSQWKTFKTSNTKWFYKKTGEERMFGPFPTEADARATAIIARLEAIEKYTTNALSPKI